MRCKIENIGTETWQRILEDLRASGFREVSRSAGVAGGVEYIRYDLTDPAAGEVLTFEWDNWMEGAVTAGRAQLEAIRERYDLSAVVEVEPTAAG